MNSKTCVVFILIAVFVVAIVCMCRKNAPHTETMVPVSELTPVDTHDFELIENDGADFVDGAHPDETSFGVGPGLFGNNRPYEEMHF
jgi:hypothetical protein